MKALASAVTGALVLAAIVCISGRLLGAQRAERAGQTDWRYFRGDAHATKYSRLDQSSKDNIARLRIAWRWPSADRAIEGQNPLWRPTKYEDTPLVVNGTLYTVTSLGVIAALDPATGQT